MYTADDIVLLQTCCACPEQYDAYIYTDMNSIVGYLRLRWGYFSVQCPDVGGEEVYYANTQGDGIFDCNERDMYLTEAKEAIANWLNRNSRRN